MDNILQLKAIANIPKFGICLLIKNENRYINEWLEWHLSIGVERFFIYDNGSVVPIKESVEEQYKQYCYFVDWVGEFINTQLDCYRDCLARFKDKVEWLAFIDTDEFLRPITCDNIVEFMNDYADYDALYVRWTCYNANGLVERDERPVRERFTQSMQFDPSQLQGKTILRPNRFQRMGSHFPMGGMFNRRIVLENYEIIKEPVNGPCNKITIDHYYTRSFEEWKEKLGRGFCDPRVTRYYDEFFTYNPDLIYLK